MMLKIDIYFYFYTKLVVIEQMTLTRLFNVLQTADFSTVTGIHHVHDVVTARLVNSVPA